MASDTRGRRSASAIRHFHRVWESDAWDALADGAFGSQYQRALAEFICQGTPPGVWVWIAEWLERDGEGSLIVDDTDADADDDPDLYGGEPGTLPPGFPYD